MLAFCANDDKVLEISIKDCLLLILNLTEKWIFKLDKLKPMGRMLLIL